MILGKQNIIPQKQGLVYALSTGKQIGAFLAKDIAHQNLISVKLLSRPEQETHTSFMKTVQKQQTELTNYNTEVDSFLNMYKFDTNQLSNAKTIMSECTNLRILLKSDLLQLNTNITNQTVQLQQSAAAALKTLRQKIKMAKNEQMAHYSKLKTEMQKVEQCFGVVGSALKQCDRKLNFCEDTYHGQKWFE